MQASQEQKTLYFRRKNKTTYALTFKRQINIKTLSLLLSRKESIDLDRLLLFCKGHQLIQTSSFRAIEQKTIIHIVNTKDVLMDTIKINVRYLNKLTNSYSVSTNMKVKDFIQTHLTSTGEIPYFHVGLIYLGKIMHPKRSFVEEYVENQAEIIIVNIKEYIKQQVHTQGIMDISQVVEGSKVQPKPEDKDKEQKQQQQQIGGMCQETKKQTEKVEIGNDDLKQTKQQIFEAQQINASKQILQTQQNNKDQLTHKNSNNQQNKLDNQQIIISDKINQNQKPIIAQNYHQQHSTQNQISTSQVNNKAQNSELFSKPQGSQLRCESEVPPLSKNPSRTEVVGQYQIINLPDLQENHFVVKVSSVDSESSDDDLHNLVVVDANDHIKLIQQVDEHHEQDVHSQENKQNQIKKESIKDVELTAGDFMYPGANHQSQTQSFIERMLKEYKFLFQ